MVHIRHQTPQGQSDAKPGKLLLIIITFECKSDIKEVQCKMPILLFEKSVGENIQRSWQISANGLQSPYSIYVQLLYYAIKIYLIFTLKCRNKITCINHFIQSKYYQHPVRGQPVPSKWNPHPYRPPPNPSTPNHHTPTPQPPPPTPPHPYLSKPDPHLPNHPRPIPNRSYTVTHFWTKHIPHQLDI